MKELRKQIEIDAPPEQVWNVLLDFDSYPQWNPFIRRIEGKAEVGSRLRVRIEPPGVRGMTFKPTVQAVEPAREFRWLGTVPVPGLFSGEHCLEIEPLANGRSRFVQSERFNGLLVRPLARMLVATEHGFDQMNQALKRRAEQQTGK